MIESSHSKSQLPEPEGGDRFVHPPRRWIRIPIIFSGIAVIYVLALKNGINTTESGAFILLLAVAVLDSVFSTVLSIRAPREFRVDGQHLSVVWRRKVNKLRLDSVKAWRVPRVLYKGVVVLSVEGSRFVVFDDLTDFKRFMSIIEGAGT